MGRNAKVSLAGLGMLAALVLVPPSAEACWFRCCKARPARVTYVLPVDPDPVPAPYADPVAIIKPCQYGYVMAKCNDMMKWEEVFVLERKEACIRKTLLGESCGRPRPRQDEKQAMHHGPATLLYPSMFDPRKLRWDRSRVGEPVDGFVPAYYLPKEQVEP